MAKRLIWTQDAQNERKKSFEYFNKRNQSKRYSKKLNDLFLKSIQRIQKNNELGIFTDIKNVRTLLIKDYQIVYTFSADEIVILNIWDCRQNPKSFYNKIRRK